VFASVGASYGTWWQDKLAVWTPSTLLFRENSASDKSVLFQKPVDAIVATNVGRRLLVEPSNWLFTNGTRSLMIIVQRLDDVGA